MQDDIGDFMQIRLYMEERTYYSNKSFILAAHSWHFEEGVDGANKSS